MAYFLEHSERGGRGHEAAVGLLVGIGAPAVRPMVRILRSAKPSGGCAAKAARNVLQGIGEPAIPELRAMFEDGAYGVRDAAAEVLTAMGPVALPHLVDVVRSPRTVPMTACEAAEALGRAGTSAPPGAADVLRRRILGDGYGAGYQDYYYRPFARALVQVAGAVAVPALAQAVAEAEAQCALAAAETLGSMGKLGASAAPTLQSCAAGHADAAVRQAAAEALGKVGRYAQPARSPEDGAPAVSGAPTPGGTKGLFHCIRRLFGGRAEQPEVGTSPQGGTFLGKPIVSIPTEDALYCDLCNGELAGRDAYANPYAIRDPIPVSAWAGILSRNDPVRVSKLYCEPCFTRYVTAVCEGQGTSLSEHRQILKESQLLAQRHLVATGRAALIG